MVWMAPETGESFIPSTWPSCRGPGPCSLQSGTPARLTDNILRTSNSSNLGRNRLEAEEEHRFFPPLRVFQCMVTLYPGGSFSDVFRFVVHRCLSTRKTDESYDYTSLSAGLFPRQEGHKKNDADYRKSNHS